MTWYKSQRETLYVQHLNTKSSLFARMWCTFTHTHNATSLGRHCNIPRSWHLDDRTDQTCTSSSRLYCQQSLLSNHTSSSCFFQNLLIKLMLLYYNCKKNIDDVGVENIQDSDFTTSEHEMQIELAPSNNQQHSAHSGNVYAIPLEQAWSSKKQFLHHNMDNTKAVQHIKSWLCSFSN